MESGRVPSTPPEIQQKAPISRGFLFFRARKGFADRDAPASALLVAGQLLFDLGQCGLCSAFALKHRFVASGEIP